MPRQYDVVIERDTEGYYIAPAPQIPRATPDLSTKLWSRFASIELCLDATDALQDELEFAGIQRVMIAA